MDDFENLITALSVYLCHCLFVTTSAAASVHQSESLAARIFCTARGRGFLCSGLWFQICGCRCSSGLSPKCSKILGLQIVISLSRGPMQHAQSPMIKADFPVVMVGVLCRRTLTRRAACWLLGSKAVLEPRGSQVQSRS